MNQVFHWREAPAGEFAVIGNPVDHSLSPLMHESIYKRLGLDLHYWALRVEMGQVPAAISHLREIGYIGVNVTVPHKEEILGWCSIVDPFASSVRAANTVRLSDRSCINTDAPGFMDTLAEIGLEGRDVLVLGAGGSARALVAALVAAEFQVRVFNRTAEKAIELAEAFGAIPTQVADPEGVDLILNTTSAAFDATSPPVLWDRAKKSAVAYDLMYAKEETPFLRKASDVGLRTVDGLPLLVAQGARSFEWWTGLEAPRREMAEALDFR